MAPIDPSSIPPDIRARGYDPRDANPRLLTWFVIVFILTAVVLHTGLWFLLQFYLSLPRSADLPQSAVPVAQQYVAPHLQPSPEHNYLPAEDLQRMRQQEHRVFGSMGWSVDPETGLPRIPPALVQRLEKEAAR